MDVNDDDFADSEQLDKDRDVACTFWKHDIPDNALAIYDGLAYVVVEYTVAPEDVFCRDSNLNIGPIQCSNHWNV
jgi:hypothetical protein